VLDQWKVADKSNEINAVPELVRALELAGCIVTVDAMECQKTITKQIKETDPDYHGDILMEFGQPQTP